MDDHWLWCYGQEMVSNLSPRPVPGVGAEAAYIESRLLDKAGRVRDLNKLAREIGDLGMQFTYLDCELREHLRRPMAHRYYQVFSEHYSIFDSDWFGLSLAIGK